MLLLALLVLNETLMRATLSPGSWLWLWRFDHLAQQGIQSKELRRLHLARRTAKNRGCAIVPNALCEEHSSPELQGLTLASSRPARRALKANLSVDDVMLCCGDAARELRTVTVESQDVVLAVDCAYQQVLLQQASPSSRYKALTRRSRTTASTRGLISSRLRTEYSFLAAALP